MFKVLMLLCSVITFIYGIADMLHIIKHVHPYSDAIAILLASVFYGVYSLLGNSAKHQQATRN